MEINDFICFGFCVGIMFSMLQDLIFSITDYLREKSWRVRDYERIIGKNLKPYDLYTIEDKEIVCNAINNYEKRETKRKNLDRFLNKFRRNKKDKTKK